MGEEMHENASLHSEQTPLLCLIDWTFAYGDNLICNTGIAFGYFTPCPNSCIPITKHTAFKKSKTHNLEADNNDIF